MTRLRLHNTATRRTEDFTPIDPGNVRMYVCGPTVYDRAHLGNARPVVVFDVLYRLLRHVYGPDHVTYVRNFTDVDDKIIARAAESGRPIDAITTETTQWFLDDMAALGALEPTAMPRATAYIPQMVAMIADLIAKRHAYEAEGHVLFAVDSYAAYGKLSGRSVDDMIAGARVDVAPYKRNPMDFVLWKPARDGEPGWDSPWGYGRPGWHIECSAMAHELLGESFDIHGGGNDLMFPHHENEIAQSCCAHPGSGFARVWMHNEMLQVEGKKMSKSLGNFFTVRDLLDKGYPGEVIRFVMLSTHYRRPMDWTEKKAEEARQELEKWALGMDDCEASKDLPEEFIDALCRDLDTHGAITALRKEWKSGDLSRLKSGIDFLGLQLTRPSESMQFAFNVALEYEEDRADLIDLIDRLIAARNHARKVKDYAKADAIRGFLQIAGVSIRDSDDRTEWTVGFDQEPFGWLAVSQPVQDGKTKISMPELLALAEQRGVEFSEGKKGRWKNVSVSGEPDFLQVRFLKLAAVEAEL